MEEWIKKLQDRMDLNTRTQNASLKNLETHIEQLAKDYQAKAANEVPNPSVSQCKAIFANNEEPTDIAAPKGIDELHRVSFISNDNVHVSKETKKRPPGVLPCDPNETMILCRPFVTTIYARIDVFDKEILLGVGKHKIVFDMNRNVHHSVSIVEKMCLINKVQEEKPFNTLEIGDDLFSYDSPLCLEIERINHICETNQSTEYSLVCNNVHERYEGEKGMNSMVEPKTTVLRWTSEWVKVHGNDPKGDGHKRTCPRGGVDPP
nr:hypothetical protein [Tanacetum cinerariifolium]